MSVKFLKIARMIAGNKIVDPDTGNPTTAFLRAQNDSYANLESTINSIKQQTDDIQFSLQQAGIAITNAAEAKAIALQQGKEASLVASYVSPDGVLSSAVDSVDSSKAMIMIADHTRKYGDGSSVAVTGAALHGLDLASFYYITYTDAARTGGVVTYIYTTDYLQAGQGMDRHLVGSVAAPNADASPTDPPISGGGTRPPGVGGPREEPTAIP
ncbi:hypothetical protein [Sphingomonas sp. GB1N7]|uniref:hypothetical protein n=1 Tax=Parasphingomonas caseinilytica TaxID=3096158 RepID=UPI002FC9F100